MNKRKRYELLFDIAHGLVFLVTIGLTILFCSTSIYGAAKTSVERLSDANYNVSDTLNKNLANDDRLLEKISELIAKEDSLESEIVFDILHDFNNLVYGNRLNILTSENKILTFDHQVLYNSNIDFEDIKSKGHHISTVSTSIRSDVNYETIVRHFNPIIKDNQTIGFLYDVIPTKSIPEIVNAYEFDGNANVFIIDKRTGEYVGQSLNRNYVNVDDLRNFKTRYGLGKTLSDDIDALLEGKEGELRVFTPSDSTWYSLYYRSLETNDWAVVISVKTDIAVKNVKEQIIGVSIIIIIELLVFIIYYASVIYKNRIDVKVAIENERLAQSLEESEHARKAKETFLFNMSHDIRTPMNAIIGFTQMAINSIEDEEKAKDCLNKIQISSEHLLKLINDVLDMARIESGKLNIRYTPNDIVQEIDDVILMFDSNLKEKNIKLTFDHNVTNRYVENDKLRFGQVLLNIIGNAVKFTNNDGLIEVKLDEYDSNEETSSYHLSIKDNGIGMSEEFQEKIFSEFERERTSNRQVEGSGLGMAITKNIIDLMGQSIRVESKLGVGTTFYIDLVLKKTNEPIEKSKYVATDVLENLEGLRILIVEDSLFNREIAKNFLDQEKIFNEYCVNGLEAVERIKEVGPKYYDMVLMDIQMPLMDGYEATKAIRELGDEFKDLVIIAVTANAFEEDKINALNAGMNGHVSKPIKPSELHEALLKNKVIK